MKKIFILLFCLLNLSLKSQISGDKTDTVNLLDINNKRHAYWVIRDKNNRYKLEEGRYISGKKEGIWKKYYSNGQIMSEVTYLKNFPVGTAKVYYSNGNICEIGNWNKNKWINNYQFFHENGKIAFDWKYSETGKRQGIQRYYHENGNLQIEGEWTNGQKNGYIKQFDKNGELIYQANYANGKVNKKSIKKYKQKLKVTDTIVKQIDTNMLFDGNGYHKLYNIKQKIEREGFFEKGKLLEGKRFFYDSNDELIKTEVYSNGVLIQTIKE